MILQAKNTSGYQETVIEKLHFHLPTLLDMGREEEDLVDHTNAKLMDRTRRFLHVLEELASSFPQVRFKVTYASTAESPHPNVKSKGDRLRRALATITSDTSAELEYVNAADLRERTACGAKAVAQLVFTETPLSAGTNHEELAKDFAFGDHRLGVPGRGVRDLRHSSRHRRPGSTGTSRAAPRAGRGRSRRTARRVP